ncbi:MAG: hypothetical protein WA972_05595 [Rhodococcus qingshengii]
MNNRQAAVESRTPIQSPPPPGIVHPPTPKTGSEKMTTNPIESIPGFKEGIAHAERIIVHEAGASTRELGFGFVASEHAPNTFAGLKNAWQISIDHREPLPVSPLNLDDCFFRPEVIHAQRFYHDAFHMVHNLSFDLRDEVELGFIHMEALAAHGISRDSMAYQILFADFVGQAIYMMHVRRFVSNQSLFIADCVSQGMERAIFREANRSSDPGQQVA